MRNEQVRLARWSGAVTRWHCHPLIKPESVAEHTFNVMNLLLILTDGCASRALLLAALTHDMGEYQVGDIPAPTKRGLPELAQREVELFEHVAMSKIHPKLDVSLTIEEVELLKLVDRLDGLLKCMDELRMGNTFMLFSANNYYHYIRKEHPEHCKRSVVMDILQDFTQLREAINVR